MKAISLVDNRMNFNRVHTSVILKIFYFSIHHGDQNAKTNSFLLCLFLIYFPNCIGRSQSLLLSLMSLVNDVIPYKYYKALGLLFGRSVIHMTVTICCH